MCQPDPIQCEDYYDWYNFEHHHSGLNGYTPEQVFTGRFVEVSRTKQAALDKRFAMNPERFVRGRPMVKLTPSQVCINPISAEDLEAGKIDNVNFPTLTAAGYVKTAC